MIGIWIVLIIIVIAAFALWYYRSDHAKRRRANDYISRSAGGFDDAARAALEELTTMDQMTAADRFARASVIEYNVFEGAAAAHPQARNAIALDYIEVLAGIDDVPQPQFMLGRMEQFRDRVAIQPVFAGFDVGPIEDFHALYTRTVPIVTAATIEERRERATAAADTPAEAAELYFEDATEWADDPQNVHDSAMNRDLCATLAKLAADTPAGAVSPAKAIHEAERAIAAAAATASITRTAAANANRVLTKIAEGNTISTFGGAREDEIFGHVWNRAGHPLNAAAADNIRMAIITALIDSVEHDSVVCANGRAARLINSLALLDFDSSVGQAMTSTAYKNQVYEETKNILAREIEIARASDDADWRAVGESMEGLIDDEQLTAEQQALHGKFIDRVKRRIDINVDKYSGKLSADAIERLRAECYAGVDL